MLNEWGGMEWGGILRIRNKMEAILFAITMDQDLNSVTSALER